MIKKIFVFTLGAMLFALSLSAEAQQPTKIPRIGFLTTGTPVAITHLLEGFNQRLGELGYVEGQNVLLNCATVRERLSGSLSLPPNWLI